MTVETISQNRNTHQGLNCLIFLWFCKFLETVAVMQILSVDVQNVGVFNDILSLVQFLFSFVLSSLSCVITHTNKENKNFSQG